MWQRADVGDLRVGIVHGDAQSLAGWGFAQEHLREAAHRDAVRGWFAQAAVDVFACTHTCLPVFQALRAPTWVAPRWVLNNGAAGMPNIAGDSVGLLTRISSLPYRGVERRWGVRVGLSKLHVDALAIEIDARAWQAQFLRLWPPGSDAHASYFNRIVHGPAYRIEDAIRSEQRSEE